MSDMYNSSNTDQHGQLSPLPMPRSIAVHEVYKYACI